MNTKRNIKALWKYLNDAFEPEDIETAFKETVEGFGFEPAKINAEMIDALSENEARTLFFDIGYMAVNGLFGGDFHTWNEVLFYSLEFDEETIDFLNY